jgi:hypothetical protein
MTPGSQKKTTRNAVRAVGMLVRSGIFAPSVGSWLFFLEFLGLNVPLLHEECFLSTLRAIAHFVQQFSLLAIVHNAEIVRTVVFKV